MSQIIYKYPLKLQEQQAIQMPANAQLLDVQFQHGQLTLWALVDVGELNATCAVAVCGTGFDLVGRDFRSAPFARTLQDDQYVWRVFVWPPAA